MVEIAQAQPAIVFAHGQPVQAERAHFGPEVARETVVQIDLCGDRRNAFVGKSRDGFAQHQCLVRQAKVEFGRCAHGILVVSIGPEGIASGFMREIETGCAFV